jgi:chromosome segregation ATPase
VATRTPAEVLRDARHRDSQEKRQRVRDTLDQMLRSGDPVSFAAVARTAHVSTWLVYAEGVREHIQHAITRQATQPAAAGRAGLRISQARLRADLELARTQIRQLRAERDQLREKVRSELGAQVEQLGRKSLTDRIDELTRHSQALAGQHQHAVAENETLRRRVSELEDELSAARTSLRRMIKETSTAAGASRDHGGGRLAVMT